MRETIELNLKDLENLCFEGSYEELLCIEKEFLYVDLEDGYFKRLLTIQRNTDNKYFELIYKQNRDFDLSYNDFPIIAKEVFPEIITKVIYK